MSNDDSSLAARDTGKESGAATPPRVDSTSLFGAARELIILHNGREYRLRRTQNEKLILTA